MVIPSLGAMLRTVASSAACPATRCCPAVMTAGEVPFAMAICPTGYSQSPAARTFTTKSRSASVSGPNGVLAMMRSVEVAVFSTPSMAG